MTRPANLLFVVFLRAVLLLALLGTPSLASAAEVRLLRDDVTVSHSGHDGEWTWLTLRDTSALRAMPTNWVLHVDQARFARISVIATLRAGGEERFDLPADALGENWAPGGVLSFRFQNPGRNVAGLRIGLDRLDSLSLLRNVSALSPHDAHLLDQDWLLLIGVLCGLLASAFIYNAFVYAGQRYPFQRWYLAWVATAIVYTLTWTGVGAYFLPRLAGPMAVRVDAVLVGVIVALGSNFLLSVLERGMVPPRLARALRILTVVSVAAGVLAADERLIDAQATDRLMSYVIIACVALSMVAIGFSIARRSRLVWLYLVGWSPVICVFVCRMARNFGLVEQSDLVDMATFAALGFESVVFSLLIADRFLSLRRERDAAEASARDMEIERETLRRAAHADFLTGLGNRAFFHEQLRDLVQRGARFTLLLIDVDYLKDLNDRHGHDAGDALLQFIGSSLAMIETEATRCARIGGDEFAIVCEDEDEFERLRRSLDDLQGSVWARQAWSGILSLSIGAASSDGSVAAADLYQQADLALYEAKRIGRGRLHAFDDRLRDQVQSNLDLIREARRGLAQGEFALYFQPIVDVRSSRLVGAEALLRWKHPTRGVLTPVDFRPALADREVGAALQERALALAIRELRRRPTFDGTLAVNFTAMDLRSAEAAHKVIAKLASAKVRPGRLCVEVTEGTILAHPGHDPAGALRVLHEAGVRIALDDFGTGYASLVHLKEIPVDTLKIDRSFIAGLLDGGRESEEIVRAVLALGHGLNKAVVAEGVESVAQLVRLRELGCDLAQGYLFGHPSPGFPTSAAFQAAA